MINELIIYCSGNINDIVKKHGFCRAFFAQKNKIYKLVKNLKKNL